MTSKNGEESLLHQLERMHLGDGQDADQDAKQLASDKTCVVSDLKTATTATTTARTYQIAVVLDLENLRLACRQLDYSNWFTDMQGLLSRISGCIEKAWMRRGEPNTTPVNVSYAGRVWAFDGQQTKSISGTKSSAYKIKKRHLEYQRLRSQNVKLVTFPIRESLSKCETCSAKTVVQIQKQVDMALGMKILELSGLLQTWDPAAQPSTPSPTLPARGNDDDNDDDDDDDDNDDGDKDEDQEGNVDTQCGESGTLRQQDRPRCSSPSSSDGIGREVSASNDVLQGDNGDGGGIFLFASDVDFKPVLDLVCRLRPHIRLFVASRRGTMSEGYRKVELNENMNLENHHLFLASKSQLSCCLSEELEKTGVTDPFRIDLASTRVTNACIPEIVHTMQQTPITNTAHGKSSPNLFKLHLERTNMSSPVLRRLVASILEKVDSKKAQVGALWVHHCGLDDKGAKSIAELIRAHDSLREVHISHNNKIGPDGIMALINAAYESGRGDASPSVNQSILKSRLGELNNYKEGKLRVEFWPSSPHTNEVHVVLKVSENTRRKFTQHRVAIQPEGSHTLQNDNKHGKGIRGHRNRGRGGRGGSGRGGGGKDEGNNQKNGSRGKHHRRKGGKGRRGGRRGMS
eukprot:jgi/Bigna1/71789/fgenesh1_pg.17_\